jgi:hypothetical protein
MCFLTIPVMKAAGGTAVGLAEQEALGAKRSV